MIRAALLFPVLAGATVTACTHLPAPSAAPRAAPCTSVGPLAAATPAARQIDTLLTRYAEYGFAGSVLVRDAGRPILNQGYGWADSGAEIQNGPATLYDVGSLAKTFTATAILDLEARGKLDVEDPLSRHLPGLPADKGAITLHHLLTHTSGYPLDAADLGVTAEDSTEQLLLKAASAKLLHTPGSAYHYSNVGYVLLAHLIGKVSGGSWQTYVRKRLLAPAGLKSTFLWGEPLPRRVHLATGYMGGSEEEAAAEPPLRQEARSPLLWRKYLLGSGGVFASVTDLDRWWCVLQGNKILPEAQRRKMFAIQAPNQGYGWNITQAEGRVTRLHRGGLRGSYQTLIAHYPERQDLIVYGINKNVSNMWASLAWRNVDRVLQGEAVVLPPSVVKVSNGALARRAGRYRLGTGGRLTFRSVGGSLYFGAEGQAALDALEYGDGAKPESRERLHRASLNLVSALTKEDQSSAKRIAATTPDNFQKLVEQWNKWAREIGGSNGVELLGSTPGSESHTRIFLGLRGSKGDLVIRFLWDAAKGSLLAWGDDIPLPAYARLWPQDEDNFASHDFATGRTQHFRFRGDGGVVVTSGAGRVLLSAAKEQ